MAICYGAIDIAKEKPSELASQACCDINKLAMLSKQKHTNATPRITILFASLNVE